jgi:hypothetical protein
MPLCGNDRCPHGGSTYRCARCELVVCYCSGDDEVAVCDECWGELDALDWPGWVMAFVYGNDDRTVWYSPTPGPRSCGRT